MQTKFVPAIAGLDQVTKTLGPGEIVGFTANTFAAFDGGGDLESLPGWAVNTDTGGASALLNLAPSADTGSPTTWVINNFQNSVNPSVPLVNLSFQNMQNFWTIAGALDSNSHIGFNNGIQHSGAGDVLDVQGINNTVVLGNTVDTNTSRNSALINQFGRVELNHTADTFTHFGSFVQMDGTLTNSLTGLNIANNITGTANGLLGLQHNTLVEATGSITNYANGFADSFTLRTGATMQGYNSISVNPLFETGTTITQSYNGVNVGGQLQGTITNGYTGVGVFPNLDGSVGYMQGMAANMNINATAVITNGLDGVQTSIGMAAGAAVDYAHLVSGNFQIASGATLNQFEALNLNATINNNTTPDAKLANFYFGGTGSVTNVQGVIVDVTNIASPNRKTALGAQGGALSVQSPMDTSVTTLTLAESGSNIGGTLTVAAGSPLAGGEFIFGNNMAYTAMINDDFGPDVTGTIGFTNVGFVGQIMVSAGKTIDTYNLAGGGAGVPPMAGDGGTVTNCTMYNAIGLLPSGGNLNVTNMYGFRAGGILSAIAPTNVWGISIEDGNADNYFAKNVVIGGVTKQPTVAGVELDITGDMLLSGLILDTTGAESIDTNNRTLSDATAVTRLTYATSTLVSDATEIQLNASGGTQQGIKFFDDSNTNSTTIRAAGTTTASVVYDLPPDDGNAGDVLSTSGAGVLTWVAPTNFTAPLVTTLTSGSGTFNTTGSPLYLKVRLVGPGGGGSGSGTGGAGNGAAGSAATTFGTGLLVGNPGSGAVFTASTGGAPGTASLGAASGIAIQGQGGAALPMVPNGNGYGACGGAGGDASYFVGGGSPIYQAAGGSATANTGGGGAGAGVDATAANVPGGGGGAGGFVEAYIYSPAASYSYAIGTGGAGGTAGTSGFAGGPGADGYIEIVEVYQ